MKYSNLHFFSYEIFPKTHLKFVFWFFACKCVLQLNQSHSFQEFSIKNNNSKHFPIDIQYDFIASEIPSQQLDATEYLAFLYVTLNKVFVVKNVASFDPYTI